MTESKDTSSGQRVSLSKGLFGGGGARPGAADGGPVKVGDPGAPEFPRTVRWALLAVGAQAVLMLAGAVSFFGYTGQFEKLLRKSNADAKKPKSPYTAADVAHDLHTVRQGQIITAIVGALALLLLAFFLRRIRQAGIGRWALIVISVLIGGPQSVIPPKNLPGVTTVLHVAVGIAALAMILLLLLPESAAYFRACRAITRPDLPPRPGLREMFGGGRTRTQPAGRTAGARGAASGGPLRSRRDTAADSTDSTVTTDTGGDADGFDASTARNRSKAKVRTDEAAVAKGADLARARARAASKSRRTES